jgi:hypothetical protein
MASPQSELKDTPNEAAREDPVPLRCQDSEQSLPERKAPISQFQGTPSQELSLLDFPL